MSFKHIFASLVLLFLTISISSAVYAQGIKKNDQELLIKVDANGCAASVDLVSTIDNCSDTDFAANCGKNGKDCVCMRNAKFVSWTAETDTRFELIFRGPSPFKSNCKYKSGNNRKIKCKIDATDNDYDYDVILESCPGQVYDPRIVVRTRDQ
jgi:hypothetical protein